MNKTMKRVILPLLSLILAANATYAVVINSGSMNIAIPTNFTGVYVDIQNFSFSLIEDADFSNSDVNFFFGGSGVGNGPDFQPVRSGSGNLDAVLNLPVGTVIDAGSVFSSGYGGSANIHVGSDSNQFQLGETGYFGFQLNDGGNFHYGFMRLQLGNSGAGGTILDWSYESTPDAAITVVPEPAQFGFCVGVVGLAMILSRRQRRAA